MATADVQVTLSVRSTAATTFLAFACVTSIMSGEFDPFLNQIDLALRNRRRRIKAVGSVARESSGEGR